MSTVVLPVLPSDIIVEILSRISEPEPLLRFKSVCKQWRSFIDDPVFAQSHYYDTLLIHDDYSQQLYTIPLGYLDYISETTEIQPTQIHGISRFLELPHPSCHGLILTAGPESYPWTDTYWLLNPYTHEAQQLCHIISPYMVDYSTDYIGLGYDAATDDYKVLRIAVLRSPEPNYHEVRKTLIYSVRRRAWHVINNFPKHRTTSRTSYYPDGAAFVNGAFHWIISDDNDEQEQCSNVVNWVIALDLTTETYRNLPLPPDDIRNFEDLRLDALGGYLFITHHGPKHSTLWILKDYGKENRWTRLLHYTSSGSNMRPIAYIKSKDQVIIRIRPNQFMWFGVQNKEPLKKVTLRNGLRYFPYKFLVLPASLYWLAGIGGFGNGKLEAETEKTNSMLKLKFTVRRYEQSP